MKNKKCPNLKKVTYFFGDNHKAQLNETPKGYIEEMLPCIKDECEMWNHARSSCGYKN